MSEPELFDPERRKKSKRKEVMRRLTVANAVFIVVIVALAGVSISLFGLVNHYYDAKYRAQYEVVTHLADSVSAGSSGVSAMIDKQLEAYVRYGSSVYAHYRMMEAEDSAIAIQVMYPQGSSEHNAFVSIEIAVTSMEDKIAHYESNLDSAFYHNTTYESNTTIDALFVNATIEMNTLVNLLRESVDNTRDHTKSPYSLVKRMDLPSIVDACNRISDASRALSLLIG